jgi:hypothetical protein
MRELTDKEKHAQREVEFAARHGFLQGFYAGVATVLLFLALSFAANNQ